MNLASRSAGAMTRLSVSLSFALAMLPLHAAEREPAQTWTRWW